MSWIHDEIRARGGTVRFRDFMELALYHPVHGYYTSGAVRTGRAGDFLTASTASPWYARVVARLLGRVAVDVGPLRLVDVAAGDGSFLDEVLACVPAGVVREAVAVERSDRRRSELEARLSATVVVGSVADLVPGSGPAVLHACELYDALPVHRVVGRKGELHELWVTTTDDRLAWQEQPAPPELAGYFDGHGVTLAEGQVAEAALEASRLHRDLLATTMSGGVALILDYGYAASRLFDPRGRFGGSLTTFSRHRLGRDPFEAPGAQDLTAHVNWDDLRGAADASGWREVGLLRGSRRRARRAGVRDGGGARRGHRHSATGGQAAARSGRDGIRPEGPRPGDARRRGDGGSRAGTGHGISDASRVIVTTGDNAPLGGRLSRAARRATPAPMGPSARSARAA